MLTCYQLPTSYYGMKYHGDIGCNSMDLCGRWVTDLVYEDNSLACLIPMHMMSQF